nr:IPT/TIG domain-containing protein [Tunicatimonas sp. TK19036]
MSSFQTQTPVIESMNPAQGIQGTEVTLTGKYFSTNPDQVKVWVHGEAAEVTAVSETQITFIVPETSPGNVEVQVEVNGVRSSEAVDFNYLYSFTLRHHEVRAGKTVVVNVFNSSQGNTYKIGGLEAKQAWTWLNDGYREIGVEVPASLAPGETTIEVIDSNGTPLANAHPDPLTIVPSGTWEKKQDVDVGGYYKAVGFVINDKGYVIAGEKVYSYDQATDTWSAPTTIDFLSNSSFYLDAFVIGDYAYILADTKLCRFDPATLSIEARQSFPGEGENRLLSFSDGNHLFAGLGYYYDDNNESIPTADFWKYQPSTDTWTQLADLPASVHHANPAPLATYLHGKGYIFGFEKQVEYDTDTDNTLETDVEVDIFDLDVVFPFNNRLYYGRDKFYEFDPSKSLVLEESTSSAVSSSPRFTLIFEDKVYLGVAKSGSPDLVLWKFTPGW